MQGSKYFDNQIVKVQNLEFQRDSTEKNIVDNFLTFTSQTGGIVTGLTLTGSGSPSLSVSAGVAYDNVGQRMQSYSGITFVPASGSNIVWATLAFSDFNPDPTAPPPYSSFPAFGEAQVNINPINGSGVDVSTFNTMTINQVSGSNSIALGNVTYNGAIITNIDTSSSFKQDLKLLGILDVQSTTIDGSIITPSSIDSNQFRKPLSADIFLGSGTDILPVVAGASKLGTTSTPFLEINTTNLNVTNISGLSPIHFKSDLSLSASSRIMTEGASLSINPSGQDTFIGNGGFGGTLFTNNITAWNSGGPFNPGMTFTAGTLTMNLGANPGAPGLNALSAGNGFIFTSSGGSFVTTAGFVNMRGLGSILLQSPANTISGVTTMRGSVVLASGVPIVMASSGTNDLGSPSAPLRNIYADNVNNAVAQAAPPGIITAFAGINAPAGWLLCDGSAVSRTTFAALFTTIATSYGSGNGTTTFNIPNFKGRFLRGWSNYGNSLGTGTANAGLKQATFTGHAYKQTGVRVRLGGGALSGLVANTDYFVIVVDANTLAFATTRLNAVIGTRISISGANSALIVQWEDPDANNRQPSTVGVGAGDSLGSIEDDQFRSHVHNIQPFQYNHAGVGGPADTPQNVGTSFNTQPAGGLETRPTNINVNYIIKT